MSWRDGTIDQASVEHTKRGAGFQLIQCMTLATQVWSKQPSQHGKNTLHHNPQSVLITHTKSLPSTVITVHRHFWTICHETQNYRTQWRNLWLNNLKWLWTTKPRTVGHTEGICDWIILTDFGLVYRKRRQSSNFNPRHFQMTQVCVFSLILFSTNGKKNINRCWSLRKKEAVKFLRNIPELKHVRNKWRP